MVKSTKSDSYEKPRRFRDRRDKEKISTKRDAPKNPPYERDHKNWTKAIEESLALYEVLRDKNTEPMDDIDRMWAEESIEDSGTTED
jgi:hypothetical protein